MQGDFNNSINCSLRDCVCVIIGTAESQPGSRNDQGEEQERAHVDRESLMDQEKLHSLKLLLLDELLLHLPQLKEVGGVQAIPFMQVHV